MKELIKQIDRLLARVAVSGDSVLLLADARTALGNLFRMAAEAEKEEEDG